MTLQPILLKEIASAANFDDARYLRANPDVAAAVRSGTMSSGRAHFERHGSSEGRLQAVAIDLAPLRRAKIDRLRPQVRWELQHSFVEGKPNFLTDSLIEQSRISVTDNVSSLGYDACIGEMIARHAEGIVLDAGAGYRDTYYPNVINYEIVDYETTDILGVCESLPFKDGTFDAVVSVAVLEHVQDPFLCARELSRVLRPGGELICSIPFLQPLHGFPHHYFNATPQGIRRLFDADLDVTAVTVLPSTHPIWAIQWILSSWRDGLSAEVAADFDRLTVADLNRLPIHQLSEKYCSSLPHEKQLELACATLLTAIKPI